MTADDDRAFRREACKVFGKHPNTRWMVCSRHGARGRIEDVYALNIAEWDDSDGWACDPAHPGCFNWFERRTGDPT